MNNGLLIVAIIVFCQACKFGKPSDTLLLTDGNCFEWSLVNCESNLESLQSSENAVGFRFCESGKGLITGERESIVINWEISTSDTSKNLCWIDVTGEEYCYNLKRLTKNELVLYKDNNKEGGYKKRVVCTYKPLKSLQTN